MVWHRRGPAPHSGVRQRTLRPDRLVPAPRGSHRGRRAISRVVAGASPGRSRAAGWHGGGPVDPSRDAIVAIFGHEVAGGCWGLVSPLVQGRVSEARSWAVCRIWQSDGRIRHDLARLAARSTPRSRAAEPLQITAAHIPRDRLPHLPRRTSNSHRQGTLMTDPSLDAAVRDARKPSNVTYEPTHPVASARGTGRSQRHVPCQTCDVGGFPRFHTCPRTTGARTLPGADT